MALDLVLALRLEANKLIGTRPWLTLLEITLTATQIAAATAAGISVGSGILRFVRNTDSVTFDSQTWSPYAFTLSDKGESGDGKVQSLTLRVGNAARALTPYLEACGGLVGASVRLMAVHEGTLGTPSNYVSLTLSYQVIAAQLPDDVWVEFILGMESPMRRRFPIHAAVPMHCNWVTLAQFKGAECKYLLGAASTQVATATVYPGAAGTGGTTGLQTLTGTTGTGRKFQVLVDVAGGVVTAVLAVLYGGSYTANPTTIGNEPVSGGGFSVAPHLVLTMETESCNGSLTDCDYKGNGRNFGGRPGLTGAPKFVR